MTSRNNIKQTTELSHAFVQALGSAVAWSSDPGEKPLEVDLSPPLPSKVRVYLYNVTHPPGGRTLGEHKIQLIVPGQARGERANFDHSDGRTVLLVGYEPELSVFVLWDAGLYPNFTYSRNVQVKAETIYAAYSVQIVTQARRLRHNSETVIAAYKEKLANAILLRVRLTLDRLTGDARA